MLVICSSIDFSGKVPERRIICLGFSSESDFIATDADKQSKRNTLSDDTESAYYRKSLKVDIMKFKNFIVPSIISPHGLGNLIFLVTYPSRQPFFIIVSTHSFP